MKAALGYHPDANEPLSAPSEIGAGVESEEALNSAMSSQAEPVSVEDMVDVVKEHLLSAMKGDDGYLEIGSFVDKHRRYAARIMLERNPEGILDLAKSNAAAFDALKFCPASRMEHGDNIPREALAWFVGVSRGEVPRPRGEPGRPSGFGRDFHIGEAVEFLSHHFGIHNTRNDATETTSACDVLAQALSELDLAPTTYEGVKKVFLKYRRTMRELWVPSKIFSI